MIFINNPERERDDYEEKGNNGNGGEKNILNENADPVPRTQNLFQTG